MCFYLGGSKRELDCQISRLVDARYEWYNTGDCQRSGSQQQRHLRICSMRDVMLTQSSVHIHVYVSFYK